VPAGRLGNGRVYETSFDKAAGAADTDRSPGVDVNLLPQRGIHA
jgi:hypothetical protein